jgi:hypothetical protein
LINISCVVNSLGACRFSTLAGAAALETSFQYKHYDYRGTPAYGAGLLVSPGGVSVSLADGAGMVVGGPGCEDSSATCSDDNGSAVDVSASDATAKLGLGISIFDNPGEGTDANVSETCECGDAPSGLLHRVNM